ncbi:MAG: DUF5119 domain-containing protein [Bacteroidaceae bacterium]|nr:DUF5119 domain-containing protein [Bacteroidaceae bacterium]
MKLFNRHIAPLALVMMIFMTAFTGCERKPLYLAQRGTLNVDVSVYNIQLDLLWGVDWKTEWQYMWDESLHGPLGYSEPSGVRANVFSLNESNERLNYTTRNLPKSGGRVNLTTRQSYDMVFFNNDTEYILFYSDDANDYLYATTRSNAKTAYTRAYAHYNQPDQLFGTYLHDLYVTDDPDAYTIHYDANGYPYYLYNITASLTPYTFIYLCQVMLLNNNDEEGNRIIGCNGISADGLAGGVDLFTRVTDSLNLVAITQEDVKPIQANRPLRLPDGTQTEGDIFAARIMTWGIPGIDPLEKIMARTEVQPQDSIEVGIGLTLRNGNVHSIQRNITELIKRKPAGGIITIVIDAAEIPDSIIGEKPKPGGGFDASVDNWENEIEADIII